MVIRMWWEIKFLVERKLVIVLMVDVVVSGGYYMVMVVGVVLVELFIIIGLIGVVIGEYECVD